MKRASRSLLVPPPPDRTTSPTPQHHTTPHHTTPPHTTPPSHTPPAHAAAKVSLSRSSKRGSRSLISLRFAALGSSHPPPFPPKGRASCSVSLGRMWAARIGRAQGLGRGALEPRGCRRRLRGEALGKDAWEMPSGASRRRQVGSGCGRGCGDVQAEIGTPDEEGESHQGGQELVSGEKA